jgi:hypothetical protein
VKFSGKLPRKQPCHVQKRTAVRSGYSEARILFAAQLVSRSTRYACGWRRQPQRTTSLGFNERDVGAVKRGCGVRGHVPAHPRMYASDLVLAHRVAPLLHASFRPSVAETPLRSAVTSPPSGCQADFHARAVEHARHTQQRPDRSGPRVACFNLRLACFDKRSGRRLRAESPTQRLNTDHNTA